MIFTYHGVQTTLHPKNERHRSPHNPHENQEQSDRLSSVNMETINQS